MAPLEPSPMTPSFYPGQDHPQWLVASGSPRPVYALLSLLPKAGRPCCPPATQNIGQNCPQCPPRLRLVVDTVAGWPGTDLGDL